MNNYKATDCSSLHWSHTGIGRYEELYKSLLFITKQTAYCAMRFSVGVMGPLVKGGIERWPWRSLIHFAKNYGGVEPLGSHRIVRLRTGSIGETFNRGTRLESPPVRFSKYCLSLIHGSFLFRLIFLR